MADEGPGSLAVRSRLYSIARDECVHACSRSAVACGGPRPRAGRVCVNIAHWAVPFSETCYKYGGVVSAAASLADRSKARSEYL